MLKRVLSLVVVIGLLLNIPVNAQEDLLTSTKNNLEKVNEKLEQLKDYTSKSFKDVNANSWYIDSTSKLVGLGVLSGYNDKTIKPKQNMSVAEFIVITLRASNYTDIKKGNDKWYDNYIKKAIELGYISQFEYDDYGRNITREEMSSILSHSLNIDDKLYKAYKGRLKDYNDILEPHRDGVLKMYSRGIIGGYPDGTFRPVDEATRAEAFTIIMRTIDKTMRDIPKATLKECTDTFGEKEGKELYESQVEDKEVQVKDKDKDTNANKVVINKDKDKTNEEISKIEDETLSKEFYQPYIDNENTIDTFDFFDGRIMLKSYKDKESLGYHNPVFPSQKLVSNENDIIRSFLKNNMDNDRFSLVEYWDDKSEENDDRIQMVYSESFGFYKNQSNYYKFMILEDHYYDASYDWNAPIFSSKVSFKLKIESLKKVDGTTKGLYDEAILERLKLTIKDMFIEQGENIANYIEEKVASFDIETFMNNRYKADTKTFGNIQVDSVGYFDYYFTIK